MATPRSLKLGVALLAACAAFDAPDDYTLGIMDDGTIPVGDGDFVVDDDPTLNLLDLGAGAPAALPEAAPVLAPRSRPRQRLLRGGRRAADDPHFDDYDSTMLNLMQSQENAGTMGAGTSASYAKWTDHLVQRAQAEVERQRSEQGTYPGELLVTMSWEKLKELCAARLPVPDEPYEVHGFGPKQMEMIREFQQPLPPRYPLLC